MNSKSYFKGVFSFCLELILVYLLSLFGSWKSLKRFYELGRKERILGTQCFVECGGFFFFFLVSFIFSVTKQRLSG